MPGRAPRSATPFPSQNLELYITFGETRESARLARPPLHVCIKLDHTPLVAVLEQVGVSTAVLSKEEGPFRDQSPGSFTPSLRQGQVSLDLCRGPCFFLVVSTEVGFSHHKPAVSGRRYAPGQAGTEVYGVALRTPFSENSGCRSSKAAGHKELIPFQKTIISSHLQAPNAVLNARPHPQGAHRREKRFVSSAMAPSWDAEPTACNLPSKFLSFASCPRVIHGLLLIGRRESETHKTLPCSP